jgi:predicted transcriptional regulator
MKWNLVWLFTLISYRSRLSFVVIDNILTELWDLGLKIFMKNSVFRTFFGLILKILKWNLVWLFPIMSYRSTLSFVIIDQYLTELWALGLRIFMKISVFRIFFELILQILKWNLVWLFTIMSYRSILVFVIIDKYLTELWALGLRIFMKISVFQTFFGLILKILIWNLVWLFSVTSCRSSLNFCHYWSIFDRVMGP